MSAQQTNNASAGKKSTVILAVAAVVIVALLGVIAMLLLGEQEPKRNVVINEGNAEEFILDLESDPPVPAGSFQTNMNSTWYFANGSAASENAYVGNVANNTHDVYFDVELKSTGEVILESPIIPLGSHMENISLDKDLDAGTYDCTLIYHLVDENQNTVSTLRMALTIIVEG